MPFESLIGSLLLVLRRQTVTSFSPSSPLWLGLTSPSLQMDIPEACMTTPSFRWSLTRTRWAEFCCQKLWFSARRWAVSSQQPPTRHHLSDRRVDLVIDLLDSHGGSKSILFLEAKHHGVERSEVVKCHTQAVDAAASYNYALPPADAHPVWLVMWIGTTLRIEIYYPGHGDTIAFLPGYFRLMDVEEDYIETDSNYGRDIMAAFSHIVGHPVPEEKWLKDSSPKPSVSTISMRSTPHPLSPSSAGRQKLADAAAAAGSQIPLDPSNWTHVYIVRKSPLGLIGSYLADNGHDFDTGTFPNEWRAQRAKIGGREIECWTIIAADRRVWYTHSLEPAEQEQGKGKGKAEEGPSSFSSSFTEQSSYAHNAEGTIPSHIQEGGNDEGESEEEAAQTSSKTRREWHEVRATKIPHRITADEVRFKDENGKSILTTLREWRWKNHGGAQVFAWRLPKTRKFYFTQQEPS